MIANVIILLVTTTLVPLLPFEPTFLLPTPIALFQLQQSSAFKNMNISRLYHQQDLKRSFRESLKVHHPDRGGSQQVFQQIQGLKKIMQLNVNYYDLFNVTDADLSSNSQLKIEDVVEIKILSFYVELGIFYFIAILYILAFTLEQQTKNIRKYLLLLVLVFLAYQYYITQYPKATTIIDVIDDKIPLFEQRDILKKTFIILLAIIRSHFIKRKTEEKILTQALQKQHTLPEYKDLLQKLLDIYQGKAVQKQKQDLSLWTKIKGYISKAISLFFLFMVIKNLIGF